MGKYSSAHFSIFTRVIMYELLSFAFVRPSVGFCVVSLDLCPYEVVEEIRMIGIVLSFQK